MATTPTRLTSHDFSQFSVYSNDGPLLASWKAGASVAAGFLLVQALQTLAVPYGYTWVDPVAHLPLKEDRDDRPLLRGE